MNPTTLNILSVSVFAFVLLSLVGPLLNISPGAVAIALTGCAGIVALDRFSWQGKGGNLIVDLFSSQNSEYRQRILHHEAGHFLVAHLLDIPVESYTLSAWEGIKAGLPGMGGVVVNTTAVDADSTSDGTDDDTGDDTDDDTDTNTLSRQQANRYCIIWMAGIAAESQTYGSAQGGDDDKMQLRRLWQQIQPAADADTALAAANTQMRWASLQAKTLLENQADAYQALVEAMAQRASVESCCQQIEAHRVTATPPDYVPTT
ncbi:MAG: ATP-dependent Zn protease [Cyanobacteria bacterium J06597_16]